MLAGCDPICSHMLVGDDVHVVAVAPDQSRVYATGDDRRLVAWAPPSDAPLFDRLAHAEPVPAMRLSPDGQTLATGSRDNGVRLFDAATGELRARLSDHGDDVLDVAFSADGRHVASASYDATVQIHNVDSLSLLHVLEDGTRRVFATDYSPDGRWLATGDEGASLRLYGADGGYGLEHQADLSDRLPDISRVAFSPESESLAVSSSSGDVLLLHVGVWEPQARYLYHVMQPAAASP